MRCQMPGARLPGAPAAAGTAARRVSARSRPTSSSRRRRDDGGIVVGWLLSSGGGEGESERGCVGWPGRPLERKWASPPPRFSILPTDTTPLRTPEVTAPRPSIPTDSDRMQTGWQARFGARPREKMAAAGPPGPTSTPTISLVVESRTVNSSRRRATNTSRRCPTPNTSSPTPKNHRRNHGRRPPPPPSPTPPPARGHHPGLLPCPHDHQHRHRRTRAASHRHYHHHRHGRGLCALRPFAPGGPRGGRRLQRWLRPAHQVRALCIHSLPSSFIRSTRRL